MTKANKGDFIEIEYTGKLEDGTIFDTTDEKIAKEKDLFNEKMIYGPVTICLGQSHILKGLDKGIEGKEIGQSYTVTIEPEDGFGKKHAQLIKMIPGHVFKKDNINPMKGLQVNIDGAIGTIINVSGGRILVDFNHPLAGRKLIYDVKLNKKIEDDREKIKALVKLKIGEKIDVKFDEAKKTARIEVEQLPKEIQDNLKKNFIELVPSIKDIEFGKEEKKEEEKEKAKEKTKEEEKAAVKEKREEEKQKEKKRE